MTFIELLNESVDLCRKEIAERYDDEEVIKAKIKAIAEELKQKRHTVENTIDAKTDIILRDVIDTGIGAPGIGYNSFEEVIFKLSTVKASYVLNSELKKYEDDLTVYSYEYAADQARFKSYEKTCEGVLYVLESKKSKRDSAILFTKDSMVFVKFKMNGLFQISEKLKVQYQNIIGVCQGFESKPDEELIDIIEGEFDDASTWKSHTFRIGSIDDEIVCDIVDAIIRSIHNLETENSISEYYSNTCRREYELQYHLLKISLAEQWKIITVLGEKAYQLNEEYCKDILLTTYQRQKNRAALDGNKKLESFSRRRILILTEAIGNHSRSRVRINHKRQLTIPEKIYEAMDFKDEAELIYEDGKLYLSPDVQTEEDTASELLLEELVSMGLEGEDLIKFFKLGALPAEGEVEVVETDDRKSDEPQTEAVTVTDEGKDPIAILKAQTAATLANNKAAKRTAKSTGTKKTGAGTPAKQK